MSEVAMNARAADLASAFDRSFAEPVRPVSADFDEFLAVQAGGDAYAIRVQDISGLVADRKIVPLPTSEPALLGIAGMRGGVVPVYSLAALLGRAPGAEMPRWMVLVGAGAPLGFAFDQFDGHVRVARSEVATGDEAAAHESVRIGDGWRAIAGIAALAETIRTRHPKAGTNRGKEK